MEQKTEEEEPVTCFLSHGSLIATKGGPVPFHWEQAYSGLYTHVLQPSQSSFEAGSTFILLLSMVKVK